MGLANSIFKISFCQNLSARPIVLIFITSTVIYYCFSSLCVCTVEPPPTQAFYNVYTFTYVSWTLGLMHLSTLNNVNPLGHPAILSTDGQYLQECRNPIHNACNKALATWPWLPLLLVKENPDDQNLSLLWTTFFHLFCGCSFVTISNFNASDSTYHFSPRALSRGSLSLSRFYSFQSLAMCSSFCLPFGRFQWEQISVRAWTSSEGKLFKQLPT